MIETIFDTLNAKAAIMAYEEYFDESGKEKLPLIVLIYIKYLDFRNLS
jgi:methionine synthase I (cobalamin-dependent)